MELIASYFEISVNSFELQVYDERFQMYIDFDDECAERFRQVLPRTHKKTLPAQVLFQETEENEPEFPHFLNVLSPLYAPANSPSGMSVSEDPRSITPTIDMNLCLLDRSSASPNDGYRSSTDDSNSIRHLVFVRDVASYQRTQHQQSNCHRDGVNICIKKKKYIIRIQGVKTHSDNKYTSILPEIKFPSHVLRQDRMTLVVAVVFEEHNGDQVIWRLDTQKGFLRDDVETDTASYNPLWLKIDRSGLTHDGIFKLPLRMCTLYQNQLAKDRPIFHTLNLSSAENLHSADSVPNTIRFACVMADRNGIIQWDTFGLSDFMRPKSYTKRKADVLDSISTQSAGHTEEKPETQHAPATTYMTYAGNSSSKRISSTENVTIAGFDTNLIEVHALISELCKTIKSVAIFDKRDSLIDFLIHARDRKVVLILPSCFLEILMPIIHDMPQLSSIYVFCTHNDRSKQWIKTWGKVIGIFNDIKLICHELQQIIRVYKHKSIPKSIPSECSNSDLTVCNSSFIYRAVLQEILLQIKYNEKVKNDFIDFVRMRRTDNNVISHVVNEFKQENNPSSSIWWYTKEAFIYSLLNQALRTEDIDTVFKMRYLIRDLHNRLNRLQPLTTYSRDSLIYEDFTESRDGSFDRFIREPKQYQITSHRVSIEASCMYDFYEQIERLHLKTDQTAQATLYRGQAMSIWEFEKLKQNKGGLLSFNNFLSTSSDSKVSYIFAESAQSSPDSVGILFQMTIDITISSKPTPLLKNISHFDVSEQEVLFSMHTIFRIQEMECVADRLWQVNLTLSDDCSNQLNFCLTSPWQNTTNESTGLRKLGSLMIIMGEYEKAEEIFSILPETDYHDCWEEFAYLYNQLGCIKNAKDDFDSALLYYRKALEIGSNNFSNNYVELARLFNNIGMVHKSLGHYSTGISYLTKALDIQQKSLSFVYPDLVLTYNSLGLVYSAIEEYKTALLYFQKAIEIQQNSQVSPYPFLTSVYVNVGQLHYLVGDSPTALVYLQKTLEILQHKLLFTSIELPKIYNSIGVVHQSMGNYMVALSNYQNALHIQHIYSPLMQSDMIETYDNMGHLYSTTDDHLPVLSSLRDAYKIRQKIKFLNHLYLPNRIRDLNCSYKFNTNLVSNDREVYVIHQDHITSDPFDSPTVEMNTALARQNVKNYVKVFDTPDKTLSFHKHIFDTQENYLLSLNLLLTDMNNSVDPAYSKRTNHSKVLLYYETTLARRKRILPPNTPSRTVCYKNVGSMYNRMSNHFEALTFYKKALDIRQEILPQNHAGFITSFNNIANAYEKMGKYSKALSYYKKALKICQTTLPRNHVGLIPFSKNISNMHQKMFRALETFVFAE